MPGALLPWRFSLFPLGLLFLLLALEARAVFTVLPQEQLIPLPPVPYGARHRSAAACDFDGDLDLDLGIAEGLSTHAFSWYRNIGNGTFSPNMTFAVENYPFAVACGEFTGDGRYDLVGTALTAFVLLFINTPAPGPPGLVFVRTTLPLPPGVTSSTYVLSAQLDDVPGLDIAVSGSAAVFAYYFNGTWLGTSVVAASMVGPRGLSARDVSGDGLTDLVYADESGLSVGWIRNLGGHAWANKTVVGTGLVAPQFAAIADVTLDGALDLIVALWTDTVPHVIMYAGLPGPPGAAFAANWTALIARAPALITANTVVPVDYDADGDTDILYSTDNGHTHVLVNAGGVLTNRTLVADASYDILVSQAMEPGRVGLDIFVTSVGLRVSVNYSCQGVPPPPPNSVAALTVAPVAGAVAAGTALTVVCNAGYARVGAQAMVCQVTGNWSAAPLCVLVHPPPAPPPSPRTVPLPAARARPANLLPSSVALRPALLGVYLLLAALLLCVLVGGKARRANALRFAASPEMYTPVSLGAYILRSHSLLGPVAARQSGRLGRALGGLLQLSLALDVATAVPLVRAASYASGQSLQPELLLDALLAAAVAVLAGLVFAMPVSRAASGLSTVGHRAAAYCALATLAVLLAGAAAALMLIVPSELYRPVPSSVLAVWGVAVGLSALVIEPIALALGFLLLGHSHVRVVAASNQVAPALDEQKEGPELVVVDEDTSPAMVSA